jgi:hypothetical protein
VQVPVTGAGQLTLAITDCALQLIDPNTARLADPVSPDLPPPCQQGEQLGIVTSEGTTPTSCTGYVLVDPQQVAPGAALLTVGPPGEDAKQATYLSVTGVRSVVVVRHGPDFAASAGVVASVDGAGVPLPGAGQPSLSATGRYLTFSAVAAPARAGVGTEVWRHDNNATGETDQSGDDTDQPASTELVSCLPGTGSCQPATDAGAPAISGDGSRIAFTATNGSGPPQVYVRDIGADSTRLVSSTKGLGVTAGDLPSESPAISQDGSTVAFDSTARNLLAQPATGEATNVYLAGLGPGSTALTAVSATGNSLTDGSTLAEPSLDAHGRLLAFPGEADLTPAGPSDVDSVYTFERFGPLTADPGAVAYGSLLSGLPAQSRGITVTDAGPGPTTVTGVDLTGPYRMVTDTCQQAVLHAGQQCQLAVDFTPSTVGTLPGLLTVATGDDGEADGDLTVGLTATVTTPTVPLLTVSPSVATGGQVVRATGIAFPIGDGVKLSWSPGIGTVSTTADAAGGFTVDLVILPDDELGTRTLVATGPAGNVLATSTFLIDPSPQEPPFHRNP